MRLITSNPKADSNNMWKTANFNRSKLKALRADKSPLRDVYIDDNDGILYKLVFNYLDVCNTLFWEKVKESKSSFIIKTVGIQALFDILKKISPEAYEKQDISKDFFKRKLDPASDIDFSNEEFRNASGAGRSIIRKAIENRLQINPT